METAEFHQSMKDQAQAWQLIYAFVDSMAVKCSVELRIPDIILSHNKPITLSRIATSINSPTLNISYLNRLMRFLVHKKIFTAEQPSNGGETMYGPTNMSGWLAQDSNYSLASLLMFENHPLALAPWHHLSQCVREGGLAFNMAHGCEVWEFSSKNPEFGKILNDGMACTVPMVTRGIIEGYGDGFRSIGSLVDVGGGVGAFLSEIVKVYPHIEAINFDLPHVIDTTPRHEGITYVGGDMFEAIPSADAIFMKWILHDWDDEHCVTILKNCRKSINQEAGRLLIVDIVLDPEGDGLTNRLGLMLDLVMMAHCSGGQERTELQWKKLLEEGGFNRYRIIKIPTLPSIIEAFP